MAYTTLKLESEGQVSLLTLNRPEKRNAISPEMIEELGAALDEVDRSPARVLILTGAGKAFCAGMDLAVLKALAEQHPGQHHDHDILKEGPLKGGIPRASDANLAESRRIARMFRQIYEFSKPTIAAVNGPAIAGGCGIATLCDITLATPEAKFGYTEVKIGFMPALVAVFLIRQIGEKRARDLLLTGRVFDADQALRLGLVNEVVPEERLMSRAREFAGTLLEASPTSLVYTKRLLRKFTADELDRELELALQENARIRSTFDFHEGLTAFLEKRKPAWRGE